MRSCLLITVLALGACTERNPAPQVFGVPAVNTSPAAVTGGTLSNQTPLDGPQTTRNTSAPVLRPAPEVLDTELDELVRLAKSPARFTDYRADFTVESEEVLFRTPVGVKSKTMHVIKDKGRYVAVYSPDGKQIDLITSDPTVTSRQINWPVRYHNATFLNTRITTIAYIDKWGVSGDTSGFAFTSGGKTITLTEWQRWTKDGKQGRNGLSTAHHTLRLDPILGYVIDVEGTMEFAETPLDKRKQPITAVEVTNLLASRMINPWPGQSRYDTTIYSQVGLDPLTFRGWRSNPPAADKSDGHHDNMNLRPAGFVAFIEKNGWSPFVTRTSDASFLLRTCNVWQDQHNIVKLNLQPAADGMYRTVYRYRFGYMPPEVGDLAMHRTKIDDFGGQRAVMLRMGRIEDFEDQPIRLDEPVRGLAWTNGGPGVSSEKARSGKQSLLFTGTNWPNLPQVILEPETRYRLEAWFLVQPWTAEERAAAQAKAAKSAKPGTPVPELPTTAKAWIDGDFYEWSPHTGPMLVKQRTTEATPGDWQRVELEFTTPAWDPFINLVFHAEGGKAWMDDFRLVPVRIKE